MIGGHRAADAVGGLVAGDDQLGALDGAQRARQRPAGLDHVGAVQAVVLEVDGLVGAHRQRLADRLGGALGTGGQHGHRAVAALALLDLQRLFDRALVDLVQHRVGGLTVQRVIAVSQLALRPGVWDLLDQDHDVRHECGSSSSKEARSSRLRYLGTRFRNAPPCYSPVTLCGMHSHHSWS